MSSSASRGEARCVTLRSIDLHRRRSVVVIMDEDGTRVSLPRIENSSMALAEAVAETGPDVEVVLEATWGWYGRLMCLPRPVVGCIWRIH